MTTEIRLLAHITLEVPDDWTKGDIMYTFDNRHLKLVNKDEEEWLVYVNVIDIEKLHGNH